MTERDGHEEAALKPVQSVRGGERRDRFETSSGIEVEPVYGRRPRRDEAADLGRPLISSCQP